MGGRSLAARILMQEHALRRSATAGEGAGDLGRRGDRACGGGSAAWPLASVHGVSPEEIPANRDFNREFTGKRPSGAFFRRNFPCVFRGLCAKIPTRRNRDFFDGYQGVY